MNKKLLSIVLCAALAGCTGSGTTPAGEGAQESQTGAGTSGDAVTIEFAQWWEPELPAGAFRALMDKFEAQIPGSKWSCSAARILPPRSR